MFVFFAFVEVSFVSSCTLPCKIKVLKRGRSRSHGGGHGGSACGSAAAEKKIEFLKILMISQIYRYFRGFFHVFVFF